MRIALLPLDSRPPNWQFPRRLADIAGVELVLPPRERLGALRRGADGLALAQWLREAVMGVDGRPKCDAVVFSWDALLYGGLVQSRQLDGPICDLAALSAELERIDWRRVAGYAYLTVPRLGITVDSGGALAAHEQVREYFIQWGKDEDDTAGRKRLYELAEALGQSAVRALWLWRERNAHLAAFALETSFELGLLRCHVAVEDNAPTGPHLREVAALREQAGALREAGGGTRCTYFDGADECACLLLAKAACDLRSAPPLPVQLIVHPRVPGPDRYTGLYESHSLGEGLVFLGDLLGLDYHYERGDVRWLVVHGVQPQPDVFADDPAKAFANPYLLPAKLEPGGPLFATDLSACNGANPHLAAHLAALAPGALCGLVGYNTNFNALGTTAAWLRLSGADAAQGKACRRFALERLADDVAYQSIARPDVLRYLRAQRLDAFDFHTANRYQEEEALGLIARAWRDWVEGPGAGVLSASGISLSDAAVACHSFPWDRAFEVEVDTP
jgi:hypothetical protein